MATIHPSRASLVPPPEAGGDGAAGNREIELRERLQRSRRNLEGEGSMSRSRVTQDSERGERRSPSYDKTRERRPHGYEHADRDYREPIPPPRHYGQYERQPHMQYDPRIPPPGWSNGDEMQGPPPPGAWGRRNEGGGREPLAGGYQENRDAQRKASNFSIWPPSPTSPYRSSDEEKQRKSSSKHKSSSKRRSHRSHRYSDDDDSEEEERRRRRHKRKEKERNRAGEDVDSEEERRQRRRRRERDRSEDRSRSHRHSHRGHHSLDEDKREARSESAEKKALTRVGKSPERSEEGAGKSALKDPEPLPKEDDTSYSRPVARIGPQLPPQVLQKKEEERKADSRAYGKALLPGEGTAMANFVQEGKRIPRRGEIGLSSDQIESFEKVGYVMSGSRHQRMNAVRMRKENQIISAEEQRSILKMRAEEKQKKEAEIVAQFKDMVQSIE